MVTPLTATDARMGELCTPQRFFKVPDDHRHGNGRSLAGVPRLCEMGSYAGRDRINHASDGGLPFVDQAFPFRRGYTGLT